MAVYQPIGLVTDPLLSGASPFPQLSGGDPKTIHQRLNTHGCK